MGYSPQVRKESNTTERLTLSLHFSAMSLETLGIKRLPIHGPKLLIPHLLHHHPQREQGNLQSEKPDIRKTSFCLSVPLQNGTPLQYSCLENPMDSGAWQAAVHGVAKSRTRLCDFTFTFHFHTLETEMATHSSVLAWRIPVMREPGGLPSMGLHRVGHD